jgi:hypothetical protein
MPGMRWIAGGAFPVAVALAAAGSPAVSAAASSAHGTGQATAQHVAPAGSAVPVFSRPPVATALAGVSCRSPSLCMAVGVSLGHLATDIWNGMSWHGLATPAPAHALGLSAVSCASRTRCMATGSNRVAGTSYPFAEAWNGRAWKTLAVAPVQDTLTGISCPAPSLCIAVGHTGPLAEQSPSAAAEMWNGSTWSVLSMPAVPGAQSAELSAVSCASAVSCVAVGFTGPLYGGPNTTLAEAWDGTSWQVLSTPSPGISRNLLTGISCTSASSCIAVGSSDLNLGTPLIERWDGQSWSVLASAIPADAQGSSLDGVSCSSAAACMAVGSYEGASTQRRVLTERWNGTGWRLLAAPDPYNEGNELASVSCPAADGCMAVGSGGILSGITRGDSLAEQWDGRSWQVRRSGQIDVLSSVSCPSAARCTAVGGYISGSDRGVTLAEAWNGRRWRQRDTPTPVPFDALSDVSCVGPSFCMAVGSLPQAVAERWNGRRWRPVTTPLDSGTASVSCASATRCMAVGPQRGAMAWNGRRWRPVPTARIRDSVFIGLSDVSCPAATRCIAVGDYELRHGHGRGVERPPLAPPCHAEHGRSAGRGRLPQPV